MQEEHQVHAQSARSPEQQAPSGQTQSVCPEITLKQKDEIMIRFDRIGS
jgi:hypothetical protein